MKSEQTQSCSSSESSSEDEDIPIITSKSSEGFLKALQALRNNDPRNN